MSSVTPTHTHNHPPPLSPQSFLVRFTASNASSIDTLPRLTKSRSAFPPRDSIRARSLSLSNDGCNSCGGGDSGGATMSTLFWSNMLLSSLSLFVVVVRCHYHCGRRRAYCHRHHRYVSGVRVVVAILIMIHHHHHYHHQHYLYADHWSHLHRHC